jgi:hypothetical protein
MALRESTAPKYTAKVLAARAKLALWGDEAYVVEHERTFDPLPLLFDVMGPSGESLGRCPFCLIRLDENGLCCCLTAS